jgi:predicted ATP-grasp superfamily ATP-dependent carboligase
MDIDICERCMGRVVVLGGGVAGWGVLRALGGVAELERILVTADPSEPGCVSRYADRVLISPHPGRDETAFVDFLLKRGPAWSGALLLETGDYFAEVVSRHKMELARYYRTAVADWPVLQRFLRKSGLAELAASCGVRTPRSFPAGTVEEFQRAAVQVRYPCIVKPVESHRFVSRYGVKNFEVRTATELEVAWRRCEQDGLEVIVQEVIPGGDDRMERLHTYVTADGRLSAGLFHRKLRQHPPGFGVMRVGCSTMRNPEVEQLARRLLVAGGYRGFASVEFKRDPRDNQLHLIEINVRMPRSILLGVRAGLNFPLLIYRDLVEGRHLEETGYAVNTYWIELMPELYYLLVRRGEESWTWQQWIRPYLARRKVFGDWDWRDPRATLCQIRRGWRRHCSRPAGPSVEGRMQGSLAGAKF